MTGQPPSQHAWTAAAGRPGLGRPIAVTLCLILAGCGSDIETLLAEDSLLFWEATEALAAADAFNPVLALPVNRAEQAKQEACATIKAALSEWVERGEPSFAQRLWIDLSQFVVRMVPVPPVERCATALATYRDAVVTLEAALDGAGGAGPPATMLVSYPEQMAPATGR